MSNPLAPQNEINRIPLLTCADYACNPRAYDPARSIGQAILQLAETPAQRAVLKDLVELYPGNLISGSTMTGYNCVLEKVAALLKEPGGRRLAERFVEPRRGRRGTARPGIPGPLRRDEEDAGRAHRPGPGHARAPGAGAIRTKGGLP